MYCGKKDHLSKDCWAKGGGKGKGKGVNDVEVGAVEVGGVWMIAEVKKGKGPQEIVEVKQLLTLGNRYRGLESDDETDEENEVAVNSDFLDNLVKIAQGPVTVQNEFDEVSSRRKMMRLNSLSMSSCIGAVTPRRSGVTATSRQNGWILQSRLRTERNRLMQSLQTG